MKHYFTVILLLLMSLSIWGQDVIFRQPVGIESFNNPAFTSSTYNWFRSSARFSNYSGGSPSEATLFSAGYWHHLGQVNSNIGLLYSSYKNASADQSFNRVDLNYAYQLRISRKYTLMPGAAMGLVMLNSPQSHNYTDIALGLALKRPNVFKVGYAVHHVNEPDFNPQALINVRLPQRHNLFGIYQVRLSRKSQIAGFANMNWQDNFNSQLIGLLYQYQFLMIGGGYGNQGHFMAMTRLRIKNLTLRYSYDTSSVVSSSERSQSHEVGIDWWFHKRNRLLQFREIPSINF